MSIGLLLTAIGLGVRHGFDWDHIAAISDLTGYAPDRRRGLLLSLFYALGHAAVVFVLGAAAIVFGASLPGSLDVWMGRIVGLSLIALGLWVIVELGRRRRDFRLRSRVMIVIDGTFRGIRRVHRATTQRLIRVEHDHDHEHEGDAHDVVHAHDHAHLATPATVPVAAGGGWGGALRSRRHSHRHEHRLALPSEPGVGYGRGTATGVGMLHGIGVESPTQIAVFVASTSVGGAELGLLLLAGWVGGLILANSVLAVAAGFGLVHAERNFALYAALGVVVGVSSIAIGTLTLTGFDGLPTLA